MTTVRAMDREHLAKLYTTGQYADCVVISAQDEVFRAHRNVLSQYPQVMEAIDGDDRIHLAESTKVTERLLEWMYGVEWPEIRVEPGVVSELVDILDLCDAAEKYGIPKLGDDAYDAVGQVLGQITTAEVGLQVLRGLTVQESSLGALQRTFVDRILSLLPKGVASTGSKRKRATSVHRRVKEEAFDSIEALTAPERPERAKTPTAKVKESGGLPKKKPRQSAPAKMSEPTGQSAYFQLLHCVCRSPEDPFLVQCEGCEMWLHPGCIGKGKYGNGTYKHARKVARAGDEKMYREENLHFTCRDCDARIGGHA